MPSAPLYDVTRGVIAATVAPNVKSPLGIISSSSPALGTEWEVGAASVEVPIQSGSSVVDFEFALSLDNSVLLANSQITQNENHGTFDIWRGSVNFPSPFTVRPGSALSYVFTIELSVGTTPSLGAKCVTVGTLSTRFPIPSPV